MLFVAAPDYVFISIHAPAKGATGGRTGLIPAQFKFQSTLPRRERPSILATHAKMADFNPRSREGSDAQKVTRHRRKILISIHAPAKGATTIACTPVSVRLHFNPRSREGSDSKDKQKICISLVRTTIFLWRDLGATAPGHQKNKDKSKILKHG